MFIGYTAHALRAHAGRFRMACRRRRLKLGGWLMPSAVLLDPHLHRTIDRDMMLAILGSALCRQNLILSSTQFVDVCLDPDVVLQQWLGRNPVPLDDLRRAES